MISATFTRKFSAAHRLQHDESPCKNIHGHNYKAEITIEINHGGLSDCMVIHADQVKNVVDKMFDHKLILEANDPLVRILDDYEIILLASAPTTENLAFAIAHSVRLLVLRIYLPSDLVHVKVHLHETDTISAEVTLTEVAFT